MHPDREPEDKTIDVRGMEVTDSIEAAVDFIFEMYDCEYHLQALFL